MLASSMPVLQEKWVSAPRTVVKDLFREFSLQPHFALSLLWQPLLAEKGGECEGVDDFFEGKLKTQDGLAMVC